VLAGRIRALFPAMAAMEQPAFGAALDPAPPAERVGSVIGRYKLLERIGEGGFGVVYMAEQLAPVRRKVALKVIKPGFDTRQVIARFEAERQALALMDHENIARVLDAGATDSGRPYFVMELVHGVPITDFCDANQLPPRQRLELFAQVCRAVQHAHTKGIIHRDIKPTNVLVTLHEGVAIPKVIDFGVAKATGQQLTEKTLFTNFAQMVGTPLYMSPEQAEMTSIDVDTRSDVYSLGVLLYELLTGTTPLDRERLKKAALDEVRRIIREEDPPKPSTRLSGSRDTLASVSAQRKTEPAKLTRLVRGELDWIVMKALEKDRNRRYETANGLASDVQRYLADEPVLAGPPTAAYRVRKFLRRHRGPALAGGVVLLALVGGVIGTSVGLVRAERARRAEADRATGEMRAKETAEKRLAQIEKGIDLLGAVFDDLDPLAEAKEGRPLRAILGDRLDRVVAELDGEAVGDPLVVARLQDRLGWTYIGLGQAEPAEALFAKALATRKAHLGENHRLTLMSAANLCAALDGVGKRAEAIVLFEQVRDVQVKVLGLDDPVTLNTLRALAHSYWLSGRLTEAMATLEQVRDVQMRVLGEDHHQTLLTLNNLSGVYMSARRHPEAIAIAERVREATIKKHGIDHPLSIDATNSLAFLYRASGKMKQALALFEAARDAAVAKLGPDHATTLTILNNLAWTYRAFGRLPEAIAIAEKVLDSQVTILGPRHPATLRTMYNLALAYQADQKPEKALPLFEQVAAGTERLQFVDLNSEMYVQQLCRSYEQLERYGQAEVWRRKWLAVLKAKHGPQSGPYVVELEQLGKNLLRQRKYADAEVVLREGLAAVEKAPANTPLASAWTIAHIQSMLGAALMCQKQYGDAEPLLLQGYEGLQKAALPSAEQHGVSTEAQVDVLQQLVWLYEEWGKDEEAARWRRELDARTKK
jgi:tetratricopeptide (TPR) repeat protein